MKSKVISYDIVKQSEFSRNNMHNTIALYLKRTLKLSKML